MKVTILVANHTHERLATVSQARRKILGNNPPISTLIPVPRLASDWMLFEIDALALTV